MGRIIFHSRNLNSKNWVELAIKVINLITPGDLEIRMNTYAAECGKTI